MRKLEEFTNVVYRVEGSKLVIEVDLERTLKGDLVASARLPYLAGAPGFFLGLNVIRKRPAKPPRYPRRVQQHADSSVDGAPLSQDQVNVLLDGL